MLLKTGILLISGLRYNRCHWCFSILVVILIFSNISWPADSSGSMLEQGRQLFYKSVDKESYIDQAIAVFEKLQQDQDKGLALTYIGALTALRGKHAFLPQNKLKWTNKGLEIMDKGIEASPENIEALFIHSSTCYYLPFFFHRADQAQENFNKILQLMPEHKQDYDAEMIQNVLKFIQENGELDKKDQEMINGMLEQ